MKCEFVLFSLFLLVESIQAESCITPLGESSKCIAITSCRPLSSALESQPLPSSVISFLKRSHCGFQDKIPKVCCGPLPTQQTITPTRPSRPSNSEIDPAVPADSLPAPDGECGVDASGDRLYGGRATDLDEFPWMALLGYRRPDGSITYQCGGVLINHRYVLTAGHCVAGAILNDVGQLVTIRLGEYDTTTTEDCVGNECADPILEIPVDRAIPHSGYSDRNINRKDDIALVRLANRVRYSYYVRPICIAEESTSLPVNTDVFVAGWGKTLNGKNSNIKMKLSLPIFDKLECDSKYLNLRARLTENQVCAGGEFAKDACRGDSGGPLMKRKDNGDWESVAVVSFGNGCGRDGWPGVYTSVSSYRSWILSNMRSYNS